ncbi:MAG: PTS sugar transporter subunit IIA [Pontiellaceae bacterium]|jgi:mannitol/fructose-specific phosphotransferase system IIA component (Ntr-type)|nr:PTS sugar transporter subunit IIA [Pontiellaceae bacterium]
MKLSFMLNEEGLLTGLRGGSRQKKEILTDLLNALYDGTELKNEGYTKDELLTALLIREREMTTGLGEGMAFPHIRLEKLTHAYTLVGICPEGADFQSLDQKPAQFFVLSIVPQDKANLLLLIRAAIVRFLSSQENRRAVLTAKTSLEVWTLLDKSGVAIDRNILARDIMRPQVGHIDTNATLRDAARILHKHHCDSLPLLDADGCFAGDISCYDIFSHGLPEFFANLHTISFVRNMDPFEKYFQGDRDIRLTDITIRRESPVIHPDATLMEIVFEIATRNKQILYVVDGNKKLLGNIDRFSIVDKILMGA